MIEFRAGRAPMRILIAAWLVVFSVVSASTQAADRTSRFKVSLEVNATDESLKDRVSSYMNRELRGLGDIEITESHPTYKISVIALAVSLKNGHNVGYAISYVVTEPLESWQNLATDLNEKAQQLVKLITSESERLDDHKLLIGTDADLKQTVDDLVSNFDTKMLEPSRRAQRQLQKSNN
jgi:hypothetical protein